MFFVSVEETTQQIMDALGESVNVDCTYILQTHFKIYTETDTKIGTFNDSQQVHTQVTYLYNIFYHLCTRTDGVGAVVPTPITKKLLCGL